MSQDQPVGKLGATVYDEDGEALGSIRGFDEDGFFVTTRDGIQGLSLAHEHSPGTIGEAELVWRCAECGEMGDLEALPDACPNCGASIEQLYYWIED